jgi:hypothetical protein
MMMWLLRRTQPVLRGTLVALAVLGGSSLVAGPSAHASSNWWWRRLVAQDMAYLHKAGSRCVNDILIAIRMQGPGRPLTAARRAYDTNVLHLCEEELPAVQHWQPPAPQRGPQAPVAEKVRRELWALKIAWLQAMNDASVYAGAMIAPPPSPSSPGGFPFLAPSTTEVAGAAAKVRALEASLRREWGFPHTHSSTHQKERDAEAPQ